MELQRLEKIEAVKIAEIVIGSIEFKGKTMDERPTCGADVGNDGTLWRPRRSVAEWLLPSTTSQSTSDSHVPDERFVNSAYRIAFVDWKERFYEIAALFK